MESRNVDLRMPSYPSQRNIYTNDDLSPSEGNVRSSQRTKGFNMSINENEYQSLNAGAHTPEKFVESP